MLTLLSSPDNGVQNKRESSRQRRSTALSRLRPGDHDLPTRAAMAVIWTVCGRNYAGKRSRSANAS
jgi:hypothetical protein